MAAADEGSSSAGSRSSASGHNGAELLGEFRAALKDAQTLHTFITHGVEHVPLGVWRKALLVACASESDAHGHLTLMKFVKKFMNSSPNASLVYAARDPDQYTALHRAVVSGNLDFVTMLDTSPFIADDLFPLLHARTKNGWTALHLAVCANNLKMVKGLMKLYDSKGSNLPPPGAWDFRDDMWMTPLHYGVLGGFCEVVHSLLESKAFEQHVNTVDYFRRSGLHMACGHQDHVGVVEKLLSNRVVDLNVIDCCGYTPLHWAVHAAATEVVRLFAKSAADRTIRMSEVDRQGRPVLQFVIEDRRIDHKVRRDIEKLLLTVPEVKDEVDRLYRDRQVFVDAANAILVGAALIASVTFGGWLQPPQGSKSDLQIFWGFNSLSFFFAMATVLAGAATVLPMTDVYIGNSVRSIRRWLALTSFLLLISVVFVLGAFATAGFASGSTNRLSYKNMTSTTSVGTVVCGIVGIHFLHRLTKIRGLKDLIVRFNTIFNRKKYNRRRSVEKVKADLDGECETTKGTSGISNIKGSYRWWNLKSFEKAYEREAHLKRRGGSDEERMKCFEDAFQEIKMGLDEDEATLNIVTLTKVCFFGKDNGNDNGLHFWSEFPSEKCRQRALDKDLQVWKEIETSVRAKRDKLKAEYQRFYVTARSFDEWDI